MGAARFLENAVPHAVPVSPAAATPKRPPPLETVPVDRGDFSEVMSHPVSVPVEVRSTDVPVRTRRAPGRIDHRALFVLMHVDGISEVSAIARLVGLPSAEVIAYFKELAAADLVVLTDAPPPPAESGVFPIVRST
jgi:hypothetical protein